MIRGVFAVPPLLAAVFAFSAARSLEAQEPNAFTAPWSDAPTTEISRGTDTSTVTVNYASGLSLDLSRTPEVVAVQVMQCIVQLEVYFTTFPGKGKDAKGLNLGPGNENVFGCQMVMVMTVLQGDLTNVTAEQVITKLLFKLTHQKSENLGELCFGPSGAGLPRFDGSTPTGPPEFVQISPKRWVFAATPRFVAIGVGDGLGIGGVATEPPAKRILHAGDTLTLERDFITYFFGECMGTSSVSTSAAAADPLLFVVLWCCAHELTAARDAADWTGHALPCAKPDTIAGVPEPLHGKKAKDFNGAVAALNDARTKPPFGLSLDSVVPLPMCPK
jgi:hypothetical protein